jgi:aryl-alcohol dehydrogenase-like predicted oxidoreductase
MLLTSLHVMSTTIDNLEVSRLCLGTMYFGTTVAEDTATVLLDAYVDAGGTFLDTANKYASWVPGGQGGESEALLGRWLRSRGHRHRLVIATKLGLAMPGVEAGLHAHQIEAQCDASLRRLGIETIDLLYAHADDRQTPLAESLTAFHRLRQAGKIRAIGASNYASWRLTQANSTAEAIGTPRFACLQLRHSLLRADPWIPQAFAAQVPATPELLDCCRSLGVRPLAYSPLLGGAYGRADRPLPPAYRTRANERRLAAVRRYAAENGITANQVALAWLLASNDGLIPVITASRIEQLRENLASLSISMTPAERDVLDAAATAED